MNFRKKKPKADETKQETHEGAAPARPPVVVSTPTYYGIPGVGLLMSLAGYREIRYGILLILAAVAYVLATNPEIVKSWLADKDAESVAISTADMTPSSSPTDTITKDSTLLKSVAPYIDSATFGVSAELTTSFVGPLAVKDTITPPRDSVDLDSLLRHKVDSATAYHLDSIRTVWRARRDSMHRAREMLSASTDPSTAPASSSATQADQAEMHQ